VSSTYIETLIIEKTATECGLDYESLKKMQFQEAISVIKEKAKSNRA